MTRRFPALWISLLLASGAIVALGCNEIFPDRTPGEKIYRKRCAECHGLDGAGNTPRYMGNANADLLDDGWEHGSDPGSWEVVIREGIFSKMPPNDDLTREEMRQLVHHLRTLRGEAH